MNTDSQIEKQYRAFLQTPPLLLQDDFPEVNLFQFENTTSSKPPSPIDTGTRLVFGKRMEKFFGHFMNQHPHFKVLGENIQVIHDKTTLGELDFIIENSRPEQLLHVEMAYKFYLYRGELSDDPLACWVGPNGRDRLVDKLAKLRERQFALLHNPHTLSMLKSMGIATEGIIQKLHLPGMLFMPKGVPPVARGLNPEAVAGSWLTRQQFSDTDLSRFKLAIPAKENWPLHPHHCTEWLEPEKATDIILQKLDDKRSPMVWTKTSKGEYQRFFVLWW